MQRPLGVGAFEFVVLASLRAVQLMRGCRPRIEGVHKHAVTAQLEVSQGKVVPEWAPPQPDVSEL
jgi:DNA-directed RNA polymerase subunit K/omega